VEPAATAVDSAVMAVTFVPIPLPKIEKLLKTPGMPGAYTHIHTHIHTHISRDACVTFAWSSLYVLCVCVRARVRVMSVSVYVCVVCVSLSLSVSLSCM
jgi:hypothetical protein